MLLRLVRRSYPSPKEKVAGNVASARTVAEGFSATKGILFYPLDTFEKDFLKALAMLAECINVARMYRAEQVMGESEFAKWK